MNGFSVLMLIFGIAVLLCGLYMFKGHEIKSITWRAQYKNLSKEQWKKIGKWTMITAAVPFILAVIGLIFIK